MEDLEKICLKRNSDMFGLFGIYYNEFNPDQALLGGAGRTSTFDTN